MPIYEFLCQRCGKRQERFCRSSRQVPACSDCQSPELKKQISKTSFQLQGGGWYQDGYSKKPPSTKSED